MHDRHSIAAYLLWIAFPCVLGAALLAQQAAAESVPYQARVIADGAPAQSGPGDNFYPTDTLSQGETVEVYQEKPGGWLAIRPPMGSFSWIQARDLTMKDGDLAEIANEEVASRIGSRLSNRHNAAQVRLKQGETVEILGEENIGGDKWYKISPPAGEFRWIQAAVVERAGPIKGADASPSEIPASENSDLIKLAAGTEVAPAAPHSTPGDAVPPSLLPAAKPTAPSATPSTLSPSPAPPSAPQTPPAAATTASPPTVQASGDLSHELAAIELRLSRMAAAPVNLWNTEKLEQDTAQLMARARTQPERDAIRVTQNKIYRFAEIGRRANPDVSNVAQVTRLPNTVVGGIASAAPVPPGGPYDAEGILRPVVSRRPGAPQFALVDDRGQVISFVTSTPDLNLQPYLGHRIGVVGVRGYVAEFQRANVTAARVTPLSDRIVR